MDDADFAIAATAYEHRLYEEAHRARERSYESAARPYAVPLEVTFADLRPGDYMTNEGPGGRWVKVVELRGPACNVRRRERNLRPADGEISVLFEIPEPVTVSGETHYWIERPLDTVVLVDAAAR